MSFNYVAAGSKHQVIGQLEHHAENASSQLGREIARFLAGEIEEDTAAPFGEHELVYVVKASGHSGGGATIGLNLTVETHHVRKTARDDVQVSVDVPTSVASGAVTTQTVAHHAHHTGRPVPDSPQA